MSSTKNIVNALSKQIPATIADGWSYLDQIPPQEMYRLIVDNQKVIKEKGPLAYEKREPGCIQSFMYALAYCRARPKGQLQLRDILCVHALLGGHNLKENYPGLRLSRRDVHMQNHHSTVSEAGIEHYLHAIDTQGHVIWGQLDIGQYSISRSNLAKIKQHTHCSTNAELASLLFAQRDDCSRLFPPTHVAFGSHYSLIAAMVFLKSYYYQLPAVTRLADKIRLMIQCFIQPLEVMHMFCDINLRTCLVLLIDLLINEGLPPPIFDDPNGIDLHSVDEIVEMVLSGMQKTLALIRDKTLPGFDLSDLDLAQQEKVKEITGVIDQDTVQTRLQLCRDDIEDTVKSCEVTYQKLFSQHTGDPLTHLCHLVSTTQVGEFLPLGEIEKVAANPMKPLDDCLDRSRFWSNRHHLGNFLVPTWLSGDHGYVFYRDCVSLKGLEYLFDKLDSEGVQAHVRMGILLSKVDRLSCLDLAKVKLKYGCQSNAELAELIYKSDDHWPLEHTPWHNDSTDLSVSDCLQAITKHYQRKIRIAKTYYEKIVVIVEAVQELCLVMPYVENNSERLVPLVNKLLLENQLPPVTYFNRGERKETDLFHLYSPAELANLIVDKCCQTLALIRNQTTVETAALSEPNLLQEVNAALLAYYQYSNCEIICPKLPFK